VADCLNVVPIGIENESGVVARVGTIVVRAPSRCPAPERSGAAFSDSVFPGICTNDGCDYTIENESDHDRSWCESCGTNAIKSALILAGLI
jgi:hypothetical protein